MTIHAYSYKPAPQWQLAKSETFPAKTRQGDPLRKFHLGFELEVELNGEANREEVAEALCSKMDYVYCKNDGSLNYGFEVVSHPFTWEWFQTNKKRIASLLTEMEKAGCSSWDTETCGLHIHVSRAFFDNESFARIVNFVFQNKRFTYKISRRKTLKNMSSWATTRVKKNVVAAMASGRKSGNRRMALNTEPEHTIEFRIFKGTLSPKSFFRAIEYVHAACYFSKTQAETTVKEFKKYVFAHTEDYPNLVEFLKQKKETTNRDQSGSMEQDGVVSHVDNHVEMVVG